MQLSIFQTVTIKGSIEITNRKAYVDGAMVADRLRNIKKNDTKPEVYWGAIESLRKYYGSEEISKFYSYIGVMDER